MTAEQSLYARASALELRESAESFLDDDLRDLDAQSAYSNSEPIEIPSSSAAGGALTEDEAEIARRTLATQKLLLLAADKGTLEQQQRRKDAKIKRLLGSQAD